MDGALRNSQGKLWDSMIEENRQLSTDELVEFEK